MALHDEKILESIKDLLSIEGDDDSFDKAITLHINTSFANLYSLGVGPKPAFAISTGNETWADFIQDLTAINSVKTFVYYDVRLVFDPPSTGPAVAAFERQREEIGWRLKVEVDPGILVPSIPDPLDI